ncbi:transposase [Paenibacillus odorifer]|uniref:Transposase n=1 Tax=Paenibacillus odorifer TaxID=189426 RepID=A0AAD0KIX3_9BACL|nr:transposase [Paenibacillus odorifer]
MIKCLPEYAILRYVWRIESLHQQQAQALTPKQIKREMDENNKDAIIASLKRKMKKLEEENKKLREQLKFSYAEVYQRILGNDC